MASQPKRETRPQESGEQKQKKPRNSENSKWNRAWHGMRSTWVVLPWEDKDEFFALLNSLIMEFQPAGTYEDRLVQRMAEKTWQLERVSHMSTLAIEKTEYRDLMQQELDTLSYYEHRLEGSLYRTRRELTEVQRLRGKFETEPLDPEFVEQVAPGSDQMLIIRESTKHDESIPERDRKGFVGVDLSRSLPMTLFERYVGASYSWHLTEGESAIRSLTNIAKQEMKRRNRKNDVELLNEAIEKKADMDLAMEANPPEAREALKKRKPGNSS